ncbi:MAG TPA: TonB-dependent receptor [Lysobacter sp.]|nr:TonB-dependent receptor [Lysobacter sp.]
MAKPRFTLALCCALCFAGAAVAGGDGAARTTFAIRGGPLDAALEDFARQSRVQILYAPELVVRHRSPGLRGALTPAQALERLLHGTGLRAVAVGPGTYVLQRAPAVPAESRRRPLPERTERAIASLDTVQVTGTRIQRDDIDVLTPSPVSLITREEIEASGHQTLFDLLRARPGMVGHHPVDVAAEGGSGVQQPFAAAATTSLNALGPRATLFLVDGRRIANYGLISTELGGLTDLDGIPLSMVDRIEILRGGASAIYGADAMAGVVNIILRRHLEGGDVVARYGISERGDAAEHRVSFGTGFDFGRDGHLFVAGDHFDRDALSGAQRRWRSQDLGRYGLGDWRFPLGFRDDYGTLVRRVCPATSGLAPDCLFDPPRFGTLQPAQERSTVYARLQQPWGERLRLDAGMRVSDGRQRLQSAPFYARIWLPEELRANPEEAFLDYVFFDTGPVRGDTDTRSVDVFAGLHGDWGRWAWSARVSHSENRVTSRVDGLIRTAAFADAVMRGDYRFNVTDNAPAVLAEISPTVTSRGTAKLDEVAFEMHGPWFALLGGDAMVAAGVEFGRDALSHHPDALIAQNELALGAPKLEVDAERDTAAAFAEVSLPLTRRLHVDLAARLDYREGYGSHTSPKLGLKWKPLEALTLRATAATGYRAPSLFELRQPVTLDTFDVVPQGTDLGPCGYEFQVSSGTYCVVERGSMENRDLRAETSRGYTLGLVWTASPAFSLEVDRFRIIRRDEILPGNALVDPQAYSRSARRDDAGLLVGIDDYFENIGRTDVRGWELQARYTLATARFGRYSLAWSGQYLDRLERQARPGAPAVNHAGYGTPDRSAIASLQWALGDWTTTLNARAVGRARVGDPGERCPRVYTRAGRCETPGWTTWDLNVAYAASPHWRVGLNVRNLADRAPVNYDIDKAGYDIASDDPRGRYYLLSVGYRF